MAKAASLPKRFKCSKCVKRFTRRSDGHRHFETIHAVSLVYLCPECDHDSPLKKNCERHIKAYHPGKGAKPIGFFLCEDDERRGKHHGVPRKDRVMKLGDKGDEEYEEDSDEEEDEEEAEEDAEEQQGEHVTPPPVAGPPGAASMDLPVSGMRPAPANPVPLGVFALQIVPCRTVRASPYQNAHAARGWTIKARNAGWTQAEFNERLAAELKFVRETGQVPALFEPLDVNWKIPLPPPVFPPRPQGPVFSAFNQAPAQVPAYPQMAAPAPPPQGFAPMQGTYQHAAPAFQGAAIPGPAFPANLQIPGVNRRFDGGQQSQTLPFWNQPPPRGSF